MWHGRTQYVLMEHIRIRMEIRVQIIPDTMVSADRISVRIIQLHTN